jgi:3-dehydroquinate dehydratase I
MNSAEMVEIRLDLTNYNLHEIEEVFSHPIPKIATCRAENTNLSIQKEKLIKAIESGATYVDIEIEVPEEQRKAIIMVAKKHHCRVILSYHNFIDTPGLRDLFAIAESCFTNGADVAKIVTTINKTQDNARLMALYSMDKPVVALGMGELGKITRLMAPFMGAEFSFAASDDGVSTAPGQIGHSQMKQIISQIEKTLNHE